MSARRRLTRLATAVAPPLLVAAVLGSCSIPADDQVTEIGADELGPELRNTTTTTTTTTTTAPPVVTTPGATAPASTAPSLDTQAVRLYYTVGTSETVIEIVLEFPGRQIALPAIEQALEVPRPEVTAAGLRTAVRPGLIVNFSRDRATLNISLDADTYEGMTDSQRNRAITQIVLTFTSFTPSDGGGIGFVTFAVNDVPIPVFVPATLSSSEAGAPLAFDDFRPMLEGTVNPSTTAPPTTSPTTGSVATSEPPETTAP